MPKVTRNFYIAMAVAITVLFGGGHLIGDTEAGMFVVLMATFLIGIGLLEGLESRQRHKQASE